MRIVLIGVSHWHTPFYSEPVLVMPDATIVGVSDPDAAAMFLEDGQWPILGQWTALTERHLDQTRHWRPMVNGYSSFAPESFFQRAQRLQAFPAPETIAELRSIRVSHVVLHRAPLEAAFGAQALASLRAHPDLEFVVEQDGVIIYRIR